MSRRPARFTQADVARVLRAAKAEGMAVEVIPEHGTLRIVAPESVDKAKPHVEQGRRIVL